jgi:dTDP-3-amino-3,4,6-trideoxy-alpha-D-glucose transaminase
MSVPFFDLRSHHAGLAQELGAAFRAVLESGRFILGQETEAFETEFARYCGVRHCIGVSNGLDALRLVLEALGIGAGDEVIVPCQTFIATWSAVSAVGARPVPVEPEPATYNLDATRIEDAITSKTRAILPVHLYGNPADMDSIAEIARRRGLAVIEDAAQAHGARHRGRRTGALGLAAAFSFYPAKNLGALGDGGAITTDDAALAQKLRSLRNYGSERKYLHQDRGWNARLDELQAAFLRVKLRKLDSWNERRRAIARQYLGALSGMRLELPVVRDWAEPVWHLFVVLSAERDALRAALERDGIETMVHYPTPPHLQPCYRDLGYAVGSFPIAERLHRNCVSLPLNPTLSDDDVRQTIEACRRAARA